MNLIVLNTASKTASEPEEKVTSLWVISGSTFYMNRVLAPALGRYLPMYHKTVMNVFDGLQQVFKKECAHSPLKQWKFKADQ